jgi:hypothetical protein
MHSVCLKLQLKHCYGWQRSRLYLQRRRNQSQLVQRMLSGWSSCSLRAPLRLHNRRTISQDVRAKAAKNAAG